MKTVTQPKRSTARTAALAVAGLLMAALGFATAQVPATAPATAPASAKSMPAMPTVNASVTQWEIFLAESPAKEFNRREAFDNALPSFVNDSRREPAPATPNAGDTPAPLGMIRITPEGLLNSDVAIDVQVSYKSGRTLGHWPPAKVRTNNILWQDLHVAAAAEKPRPLPENSWLVEARNSAAPNQLFTCGTVTESFLLHDFELKYDCRLQVKAGDNGNYKVAHDMSAPLLNLTFYKKTSAGKWQTGTLDTLEKSTPVAATGPATNAATSTAPATTRAVAPPRAATAPRVVMGPASMPVRGGPPVEEAAKPAGPELKSTDLVMSPATLSDENVLAPWRDRLASAGISSSDQQIILKILAKYALDPKRLTAIYRMDPGEFDQMLPLEVVPQPRKINRIALVIVTGIDPAMDNELKESIAQLGDPSWEKREAAMTAIQKMGLRAKPLLDETLKGKDATKDLEIIYRVEQLLQSLNNPDAQQPVRN